MAQKWDYEVVNWTSSSEWAGEAGEPGMKAMLLTKGTEGWELIAVTQAETGYTFFLKKPGVMWAH